MALALVKYKLSIKILGIVPLPSFERTVTVGFNLTDKDSENTRAIQRHLSERHSVNVDRVIITQHHILDDK